MSLSRNDPSAPRATILDVIFSQLLTNNAASLTGMRMVNAQRGGLLRNGQGGSAFVIDRILVFNTNVDFRPRETVFVTNTTAFQSTAGNRLSGGQVFQFTTGVGGRGQGNYFPPVTNPDPAYMDTPQCVALGQLYLVA